MLDVQQELNPVTPKVLATLADHYSPVNIARFSRDGRRLASGDNHGFERPFCNLSSETDEMVGSRAPVVLAHGC